MSAATSVSRAQRFTAAHPCPVCGSYQAAPSGHCWGFVSSDGQRAICTRHEFAGDLPLNGAGGYTHRLGAGVRCGCGQTHDDPEAAPPPSFRPAADTAETSAPAAAERSQRNRRRPVHALIPLALIDGWRQRAIYLYERADGSPHHAVVRFDPPAGKTGKKRCLPFQPVAGGWLADRDGLDYILYHLPAVLAADAREPVWITEGEKCADRLAELGLLATTAEGGAGKWGLLGGHARETLAGRVCVLLPDQDAPGRAHMRDVAADLAGVAAKVSLLDLPGLAEGGDVADWLDAGGTALDLLKLALCAPVVTTGATVAPPEAAADTTALDADAPLWKATAMHQRQIAAWRAKLRANPRLRAPAKEVAIAVAEAWADMRRRDGDGFMPIYRPAWAERLGMSAQTMGDYLVKLERAGAIERDVRQDWTPEGAPIKHLRVKPLPLLLEHPEEVTIPSAWGGRRVKRCPSCGSADLRARVYCRGCGEILVDRPVNDDDDPDDPDDDDSGDATASEQQWAPARNPCPWSQVDSTGQESDDTDAVDGGDGGDGGGSNGAARRVNLGQDDSIYAEKGISADGDVVDTADDAADDADDDVSLWFLCTVPGCGAEAEAYSPAGQPVCVAHYTDAIAATRRQQHTAAAAGGP